MNVLISWVLVVLLVVAGIGVVTIATAPMLERAQTTSSLSQAENVMTQLTEAIKSVSREGIGSSRLISIPNLQQGIWRLIPEDDTIEFRLSTSPFESAIRRIRDNLVYISGFDADCSIGTYDGNSTWVMENNYLKVYLQKVNGTIQTSQNILSIQSKITGRTITPTDSSIIIDGDPATAQGAGFSEMRTGTSMPSCRAHVFVDSSGAEYDIFYTLYSAADFLVVEVRNIS